MTKLHELWDSQVKKQKDTVGYRVEAASLRIAEQVFDRLRELNLSRKELADRLSVSRSYVSQLLGGKPNMTLTTFVKLACALDLEPEISLNRKATSSTVFAMTSASICIIPFSAKGTVGGADDSKIDFVKYGEIAQ